MTLPDPSTDPQPETVPSPRSGHPSVLAAFFGPVLRAVGGLIAVVAAVMTAVLELLLATVRIGGQLIGVSAVLAVAANVTLAWFAHRTVGRVWAVALPAVAWFVLMMAAGVRTTEGDILLTGTWVGFLTIFAGSIAFAVMAFRLILARGSGAP